MPPKTSITKAMVLESAKRILEEKGLADLTARRIAKDLECSTAPIYSTFSNMEEIEYEVMRSAKNLLVEYASKRHTDHIFLNQGVGIVFFARDHPILYREMFMKTTKFAQLLPEMGKEFDEGFSRDDHYRDFTKEESLDLREKMGIFTHGLASLSCAGLLQDDSDEFIINTLYEAGRAVIRDIMDPCEGEKSGECSSGGASSTWNMRKKVMR